MSVLAKVPPVGQHHICIGYIVLIEDNHVFYLDKEPQ